MVLPLLGILGLGAAGAFGAAGKAIAGGAGEQYSDLYAQDRKNVVAEKLDYLKRKRLMDDAEAITSQKELLEKNKNKKEARAKIKNTLASIQTRITPEDYPYLNFAAQNGEPGLNRFVTILNERDKNPNLKGTPLSDLYKVDTEGFNNYLGSKTDNFDYLTEAVDAYFGEKDIGLSLTETEKARGLFSSEKSNKAGLPTSYVGLDIVLTAERDKFDTTGVISDNLIKKHGIDTKAKLDARIKENQENIKKKNEDAAKKNLFSRNDIDFIVGTPLNKKRKQAGLSIESVDANTKEITYTNINLNDLLEKGPEISLNATRRSLLTTTKFLRDIHGVTGYNSSQGTVTIDPAFEANYPSQSKNALFNVALVNEFTNILDNDVSTYLATANHFATTQGTKEIPYTPNTYSGRTFESYQDKNTQIFKLPFDSTEKTDAETLQFVSSKADLNMFSSNTYGNSIKSFQNGAIIVDKNEKPFAVHMGDNNFITFGQFLNTGAFGKDFVIR